MSIRATEKIRNFVQQKVQRRFQQLQINFAILKHPRWVKLGTLFYYIRHTKKTFLLQQGHKNKTQIKLLSSKSNENKMEKSKYYRVASRKTLSL
jgi:hypothetical protein